MYPGMIVEYVDQSDIPSLGITEVRNKPLFGALFTSDKGTEDWYRVSGKKFFEMYGKSINFKKHGQPLLQAAMTINAGGELLCKRLVASDAALANIGIVAKLNDIETQATDDKGNPLYEDAEGNQTVEETDTPVMETSKQITYVLKSVPNATNIDDIYNTIKEECVEGEYLLYVITDIGRGVSNKRIKMIPNYRFSKSQIYTSYKLSVMESNEEVESYTFSANPYIIVKESNISLETMIRTYSTQLKCKENLDGINDYVDAIAEATGLTSEEVFKYDFIFGVTNKGEAIPGLGFDKEGIDPAYAFGQTLKEGSNGAFGNKPWDNEDEWVKQSGEALDGTYDKVIFNLDQYMLTAFVDANYPFGTKRQIETLATFREDFMYFRDQRLGVTTIEHAETIGFEEAKNKFCATYPQSYEVYDPYTKRPIAVTIGYSLAQLLVSHCDNGCILPTAGIKHGMVIDEIIPGTLSFSPTICPDPVGNEKEQLDDLRANYASYIDNRLVVESLYTSQERYTQWSFINNVMGIQEVVRDVRRRVPVIRYSFIDGEDLEIYKAAVDEVLARHRSNFKLLELVYIEDATYALNKIFYAMIKVVYRDFVQTEWFKVVALTYVDQVVQ